MYTKDEREAMRQLLRDWGNTVALIKLREKELEDMRERAEPTIASPQLTGMPGGHTISDPTFRGVLVLEWFSHLYQKRFTEIQREIEEAQRTENVVSAVIGRLPIEQRIVLHKIYREKKTYAEAAEEIGYDERTAQRREESAILTLLGMIR